MIEIVIELLSWGFLLVGGVFVVIGGIGLLRMPDFYSRVHAAGLTDTLGAGAILIGLMLQSGVTLITAKLVFILFFVLFSSPTSTHALAKAALFSGVRPLVKGPDESAVNENRNIVDPSDKPTGGSDGNTGAPSS